MKTPTYSYMHKNDARFADGSEIVSFEGRQGYRAKSIHTRFELPKHTAGAENGSVSIWVMPLEDLDAMSHEPWFTKHNPNYASYILLADNPEQGNFHDSVFSLCWDNCWYPQLYTKFFRGGLQPDGYFPKLMAVAGVGHFKLKKHKWYQLTVTWDKPASEIKIYANGILVMHSDTVHHSLEFQTPGDTLYTGNPTFVMADINFYDTTLSGDDVKSSYDGEVAIPDEALLSELRHMYCGENRKPFDFSPNSSWTLMCDRSLTKQEDLDYFYVQGKTDAASVTPEGILIETSQHLLTTGGAGAPDADACYLWTNQFFNGDLYLEYEFKSLQRDGLSLLMLQASGMQREDFMADYPLRTNGAMSMVCWEDVRNYHWEYYRNVVDVRNDVASHAMIKNPWLAPIGYSCADAPMSIGEWHKLQFLQIGNKIQCAMDGKIVLDIVDDPFSNKGPVLNCGRIAIRCMIRTRLMVRNFKVYNKAQY